MTTPSTTRVQTSSVDQPLKDTKSPDVGKLLILLFHKIPELIHNNYIFYLSRMLCKMYVSIFNTIATCKEGFVM